MRSEVALFWSTLAAAAPLYTAPDVAPYLRRDLGACDGPTRLGVAGGALLLAAGGAVTRLDPSTPLGPSPLPVDALVWLEETSDGLEAVAADGPRFTWSDGVDDATITVDGEPLGEPAGVARHGRRPRVDAPWEAAGAVLVARETQPNDRAPDLVVPVATAVALATDAGFAVVAVPVTPCDDDAACRDYGESEVVAVAGTATQLVALYDVWTWAAAETHATWAAPVDASAR